MNSTDAWNKKGVYANDGNRALCLSLSIFQVWEGRKTWQSPQGALLITHAAEHLTRSHPPRARAEGGAGKLRTRRQRSLTGELLPCWLPFLLVNGEANRTPSIAATPHHCNFPANSLLAPQAGAGRRSIRSPTIPLQGAQGAAAPVCTHLPTPLTDSVTHQVPTRAT